RTDRLFRRDGRFGRLAHVRLATGNPAQSRMDLPNQRGQLGRGDRVVADIGGNDGGSELDEVRHRGVVAHGHALNSGPIVPRTWERAGYIGAIGILYYASVRSNE